MSSTKMLICFICILVMVGVAAVSGILVNRPASVALYDYKTQAGLSGVSEKEYKLSDFSLPVFTVNSRDRVLAYKGESVSDFLEITEENLWFVFKQNEPEGIVVATDTQTVKFGGKNRSRDLLNLYTELQKVIGPGDNIKYFELEGQGGFAVLHDGQEEVYLTQSAAQMLGLAAKQKISSADAVKAIQIYLQGIKR